MKKIVLIGEGGSGKSYLAKKLEEKGFYPQLSVTTRPIRDGEQHLVDYEFMSKFKFWMHRLLGQFWEVKEFNGWYYGTLKQQWESADVFLLVPKVIRKMSQEDLSQCLFVRLHIDESIRRSRLMDRSDADNVDRRIASDKEDFRDYFPTNMVITDPLFGDSVVDEIIYRAINE